MDKQIVMGTLEQVICEVAQKEFYYLTGGLSLDQRSIKVGNARKSLDELRSLRSPDYQDPLVALAYAVLYQLRHVNMAFSIFEHIGNHRGNNKLLLGNSSELRIVDFGCGALAMKLGATLGLADALDKGQEISGLRVHSVDTNAPMIVIGEKIWEEFAVQVRNKFGGDSLHQACEIVEKASIELTDYTKIESLPDAENWLTALHVVYRSNINDVERALRHLYHVADPVVGAISCYCNQNPPDYGNKKMALRACPFPVTELKAPSISPQLHAGSRSGVNSKLANMCREWGLFPANYYQIFWDWKLEETTFLLYMPNVEHRQITIPKPQPPCPVARRRPKVERPPATPHLSVAVGDRVQTRIGRGKVDSIRKSQAKVILDNGFPCDVPLSDLRRL